jgi:general secretion pathway protein K
MTRASDTGVSLLNVLVVVAAGAGLVNLMLTRDSAAVDRVFLSRDAGQAFHLAAAGARAAQVALRRDLLAFPDKDHLLEPWASAAQTQIAIERGTFEVQIDDVCARFDLNWLTAGAFVERRVFRTLLISLDLPDALGDQISVIISIHGPLEHASDLVRFGVTRDVFARLEPVVSARQSRHPINVNTASEAVLAALFSNPVAARALVARRNGKGYLETSDLSALGLTLPPLAGYTSDTFDVRSVARVGNARGDHAIRVFRDADSGKTLSTPLTPHFVSNP